MAAKSGWFIVRRFEWKVVAGPPALALGRPAGRQGDPARRNHPQRVFWRQCTISDGGGTSFWFHSRTLNRHAVMPLWRKTPNQTTQHYRKPSHSVDELFACLRLARWFERNVWRCKRGRRTNVRIPTNYTRFKSSPTSQMIVRPDYCSPEARDMQKTFSPSLWI